MSRKLAPEGEAEVVPEDVQDLESILFLEFPEAAKQLATIAARKAISPENAVSLPKEEERDHPPKVPMADASFVMKKATKRSAVLIEEVEVAEEGPDPTPEVYRGKSRNHIQEARKSKLTLF